MNVRKKKIELNRKKCEASEYLFFLFYNCCLSYRFFFVAQSSTNVTQYSIIIQISKIGK